MKTKRIDWKLVIIIVLVLWCVFLTINVFWLNQVNISQNELLHTITLKLLK